MIDKKSLNVEKEMALGLEELVGTIKYNIPKIITVIPYPNDVNFEELSNELRKLGYTGGIKKEFGYYYIVIDNPNFDKNKPEYNDLVK